MSVFMKKRNGAVGIKVLVFLSICFLALFVSITLIIKRVSDKETKKQILMEYSSYSNALAKTVMDMDGETGCFFSSEKEVSSEQNRCDEFYIKFVKNLRVTKYCKDNGLQNGCVPVYSDYATQTGCAGYSESMMNKFNPSFVLNGRSSLIVYNFPSGVYKPVFAVDVNGLMKPNKPGFDLFSFVIVKNKYESYYLHPNIIYCLPELEGGTKNIGDLQ